MTHARGHRPRRLTPEERKSLTHGDFWIPDEERAVYKRALEALTGANVPFVVAGAYAIYEHTGPIPTGYRTRVEYLHGEHIPVPYAATIELAVDELIVSS